MVFTWKFLSSFKILDTLNIYWIYISNMEKAVAPHSSTLAWSVPWAEEPGGLQSLGSLGVGHDWATSLSLFTLMHWRRKWQPTPVLLPGESQAAWWAAIYGVAQSQTRLKRLSSSSRQRSNFIEPFSSNFLASWIPVQNCLKWEMGKVAFSSPKSD